MRAQEQDNEHWLESIERGEHSGNLCSFERTNLRSGWETIGLRESAGRFDGEQVSVHLEVLFYRLLHFQAQDGRYRGLGPFYPLIFSQQNKFSRI